MQIVVEIKIDVTMDMSLMRMNLDDEGVDDENVARDCEKDGFTCF